MSSPSISALTAGNSFSAATQALTKNDMKPSRAPLCFFSKASRYSLRSAITADMSTSLKVVSIAAVFCASFSLAAMVRRSRVMRTRCSRGSSVRGPRAVGAGVAAGAGRLRNSSTSPLVMRPSLPVPSPISAGGRCFSSIRFAAAGSGACATPSVGGGAGRATGPSARGGGFTPACGFAAGRGSGAGLAAASATGLAAGAPAGLPAGWAAGFGAAPDLASASNTPSSAPTGTSLPSGALMLVSTPADGALISTVTLSVSSSTRGSSAATASPSCFIQRATVADVTLSPSVGTLMSVAISHGSQRGGDKGRLLRLMRSRRTGGRARRGVAPDIRRTCRLAANTHQHFLQAPIDEIPRPHVLRLLLAPHHIGIAILRQFACQRLLRERIDLLQPQQGDVADGFLAAFAQQVIVPLARAKHDAPPLFGRRNLVDLRDDHAERTALGHFIQRRHRQLVTQQRLRREDHQRLAEVAFQLPAQCVEVVGRRRQICHAHVAFGAKLQIALDAGRRMLGTLAFIAVRQQQRQSRHAQPLAFAAR